MSRDFTVSINKNYFGKLRRRGSEGESGRRGNERDLTIL